MFVFDRCGGVECMLLSQFADTVEADVDVATEADDPAAA